MTRLKGNKLQLLMREAPASGVLTMVWLRNHGISGKLAWWYVKSGWLERVSDGVYKKQGNRVEWFGVVSALQHQLHLPIHVGGKAALQLLGKAHYLPLSGIQQVALYKSARFALPQWVRSVDLEVDLQVYTVGFLKKLVNPAVGIVERKFDGVVLQVSAPERAIMEVLYHVPGHHTFKEASLLMENLSQLRPKLMQELLQTCSSIKTKRLVLYLAEKFDHSWRRELDLKKIELGEGKIKIGEGGHYVSKYKISVPADMEDGYEF